MNRLQEPKCLSLYVWVFEDCIKAIEAESMLNITYVAKNPASKINVNKGVFVSLDDMKDLEHYKNRIRRMKETL